MSKLNLTSITATALSIVSLLNPLSVSAMKPNLPPLNLGYEEKVLQTFIQDLMPVTTLYPKYPLEVFGPRMVGLKGDVTFSLERFYEFIENSTFKLEDFGIRYELEGINLVPIYGTMPGKGESMKKNELLFYLEKKSLSSFIKYALCFIQNNHFQNLITPLPRIILLNEANDSTVSPLINLNNLNFKLLEFILLKRPSRDIYSTIYFGILALVLNDKFVIDAINMYEKALKLSNTLSPELFINPFQEKMYTLLIASAEENLSGIIEDLSKSNGDIISNEDILKYFESKIEGSIKLIPNQENYLSKLTFQVQNSLYSKTITQ